MRGGCVSTINFEVTSPQPITINILDTLDPVCQSTFDGRIEVEGQGGRGVLTYNWSNGITADSGILAGIDTGTYCVTVVDANNCQATFCHTLSPQEVITTSLAVSTIPCNGGTACITVNATGGSNAYAYDWTGPSTPAPVESPVQLIFVTSTGLITVFKDGGSVTVALAIAVQEFASVTVTQ